MANSQQNYVRGRVNHVTAEIALEAPDVVIGTFPVNSNSATVLFDSGASHSFITYTFIKKHGISSKCYEETHVSKLTWWGNESRVDMLSC